MEITTTNAPVSIERLLKGDRRQIGKAISAIESGASGADELLESIYPHLGDAWRIGITGPPGAGKSTLANQLIKSFRAMKKTVGVIAVDPTSPFSGGAILGDRVRMQDFAGDAGVFIRSMATRGSLGGLARRTAEAADVLDAAGMDIILLETVGVGQIELDIIEAADSILVMTVPDAGDIIQGLKAGLMEIADLFVINKIDLPGADRMKADLEFALHLKAKSDEWPIPILLSEARSGKGVSALVSVLGDHLKYMKEKNLLGEKRRTRLENRVRQIIEESLQQAFWTKERTGQLLETLRSGKSVSPYALARRILANHKPSGDK